MEYISYQTSRECQIFGLFGLKKEGLTERLECLLLVTPSLDEFKVDVDHFRMIAEYYDRKCPCWGGKHDCPCEPFTETKKCRCGAVHPLDDPKGQTGSFKTYRINFDSLSKIVKKGHLCPENQERRCFCSEFLKVGKCKLGIFEKLSE